MKSVHIGLGLVLCSLAFACGAAHLTSSKVNAAASASDPVPVPASQPQASYAPAESPAAVPNPAPQPEGNHQQPVASGKPITNPGSAASVGPLEHIVQTMNNCGPASVAEVLNHWGIDKTQADLTFLRRGNPTGMNSDDVAGYIQSIGMREFVANQGRQGVIKALIANGFPVIVSQFVSQTDKVDHFRPIVAYDDGGQYFVSDDPFMGDGYRIGYPQFDQIWGRYDRFFMVIYPPGKQELLSAVLTVVNFDGPSWMTPAA